MHGASSAQKRPTRKSLALPGATNRNTRSSMMQSQLQCYKLGKKPVAQSTLYEIWEGMWQGSESVALKVLRHGDEAADYFPKYTRLSLIWSRLQSPYILPFLGTCAIDDSPFPPFVSPWCSYGNAHQYLKGNPRADRIQICLEIAFGLQYMHNLDEPVIHGSVNGRNVLISDDGVALLSGFGLSGTSGSPFTADDVPCSSYRWMAPEISRGELTKEGDIWAWGMTALELLSGMQPFYANQSPMTVLMKTMKGERPQKLDPAGRPNIDEVVQTVKAIHAARNSR
ncbi:hypothetical protein BOTBODRAFT_352405 [Botryobasidium botryosum FD-172 SS1]|uniref:Protein kinase domain-containing protein n=1 Tax=Botryobasidium botryosum (strain FD-172 SS1) TaxID=930990 RepID=A0A067MEG9_BOTB1|nr:hypothetical protein BOTBODRAFT_352405 [Botryobasidium botryosum FD-172 SS1]